MDTKHFSDNWMPVLLLLVGLLAFITFVVGMLLIAILWPIGIIWAINQLFETSIPMTFTTWLACIILVWAIKTIRK